MEIHNESGEGAENQPHLWQLFTPIVKMVNRLVLVGLMSLLWQSATGQETYREHYDQGLRLADQAFYAESAEEYHKAIAIAKENDEPELEIEATISLAELMRKTGDYETALSILDKLGDLSRYPRLHVRKLGRKAALYHEHTYPGVANQKDSVQRIAGQALALAIAHGIESEEAALKNELGVFHSRNGNRTLGNELLLDAAGIFMSIGDMRGHASSMIYVLGNQIHARRLDKADTLIRHIKTIINGRGWFTTEIEFFNIIAEFHLAKGDSLQYTIWQHEAAKSFVQFNNRVHNDRMATLRVMNDIGKYRAEAQASLELAKQKEAALEEEKTRSRELIILLSVMGLLAVGVIALFLRQRKLNSHLNTANEKYHMLLVESNHRIKNNLQMVISMLEYASKGKSENDVRAFKQVSSKIHTIGTLHKHLYLDGHNERVNLDTYFSDIFGMYEAMAPGSFLLEKHIAPISIKSERIVYFGLILNEMIANTIEHNTAVPKRVELYVRQSYDECVFEYCDHSTWSSTPKPSAMGTGLALISQLVTRVGGANFSLNTDTGHYQFHFHV